MCSPSWTLLPPPSPYHPSGSSQCTSLKHPVSCIEPFILIKRYQGNMVFWVRQYYKISKERSKEILRSFKRKMHFSPENLLPLVTWFISFNLNIPKYPTEWTKSQRNLVKLYYFLGLWAITLLLNVCLVHRPSGWASTELLSPNLHFNTSCV